MSGAVFVGSGLANDLTVSCDVCIIGSGAGGSVLAAGLAERGLDVVVLEEGGYHTRAEFTLQERDAFPMLYQDRGTRGTADLAITILQGRSVGGGTTINWTTCFRTPDRILHHWRDVHGLDHLTRAALDPHFEAVEQRLGIAEWPANNANNSKLEEGCAALGWEHSQLRRNVRGCANSGYCGVGCPVDGKQAMHLTYLPDALDAGARLFADTRVDRLEVAGGRVVAVHASVLDRASGRPSGVAVTVRPKVTVSSAGAINGPALLLRSGLDDGLVGRRTFLHPVVGVGGRYAEPVHPYYGAPQSVGSHHFIDRGDKMGFFLECPPLQPMLASTVFNGFGLEHQEFMADLPHLGAIIALQVDGLLAGDEGGTVSLRRDGRIRVDYPVEPALVEAMRASTVAMARIVLAAGAEEVASMHVEPVRLRDAAGLARLEAAPYGALEHAIFSAHQMGGCMMGNDPAASVVGPDFQHHRVAGLYVVDGSVLPTALGVNPSQTIYGLAHFACDEVAGAV